MPTPFPGMDPYLERSSLWPDVHNRLIVLLADELAPRLRPRYYVSIEERSYLLEPGAMTFAGRSDVSVIQHQESLALDTAAKHSTNAAAIMVEVPLLDEVHEAFLEVRTVDDDSIVTVLELLSPANKRSGEGRRQYEQKRMGLLGSTTHLVEIDLLRAGQPMAVRGYDGRADYRILVSRSRRRPRAELLAFGIRQPLPLFQLPLQPGDDEPEVDLNSLLHALYDRAGYDLRIDYRGEAEPPIVGDDAAWADELLRAAELR